MFPNPYFQNVPQIGDLIMDYVIVENECPIVFICKDKNDSLYFCNCVTMQNIQKWAVTKISKEILIGYFKNRMSNYEIFKNSLYNIYIITWNFGYERENYKIVSNDNVSNDDLPPKDSYLCAEDGEFDDYIELLNNRDLIIDSLKFEQLLATNPSSKIIKKTLDFTNVFTNISSKDSDDIKYNSGASLSKHFLNFITKRSLDENVNYSFKGYCSVCSELKYAS